MVMVRAMLHDLSKMILRYNCIPFVLSELAEANLIATQHCNCAILAFRRASGEGRYSDGPQLRLAGGTTLRTGWVWLEFSTDVENVWKRAARASGVKLWMHGN